MDPQWHLPSFKNWRENVDGQMKDTFVPLRGQRPTLICEPQVTGISRFQSLEKNQGSWLQPPCGQSYLEGEAWGKINTRAAPGCSGGVCFRGPWTAQAQFSCCADPVLTPSHLVLGGVARCPPVSTTFLLLVGMLLCGFLFVHMHRLCPQEFPLPLLTAYCSFNQYI